MKIFLSAVLLFIGSVAFAQEEIMAGSQNEGGGAMPVASMEMSQPVEFKARNFELPVIEKRIDGKKIRPDGSCEVTVRANANAIEIRVRTDLAVYTTIGTVLPLKGRQYDVTKGIWRIGIGDGNSIQVYTDAYLTDVSGVDVKYADDLPSAITCRGAGS